MEILNYLGEIWKDIKGFEGLYQVSNFGRVKSLDKIVNGRNNKPVIKKGKILKQVDLGQGYVVVCLRKELKNNQKFVHRLVAEAFIPNPNNLPQVNHKDENKKNNCVDNLEWCTAKYNANYGTRTNRIFQNRVLPDFTLSNNPNAKRVDVYSLDGTYELTFNSIKEAFIYLKINGSQSNVSMCCNGKLKTAYRHIWKWPNPVQ